MVEENNNLRGMSPLSYKIKNNNNSTIKVSKLKFFLLLNWRIILLILLLLGSVLFILWSNSEVDNNFTNTFT